jgi:predicted phosphodiesterase
MEIISHNLPENHRIYLLGDTHEGSKLQDSDGFQSILAEVKKDKNAYIAHLGDLAEAIMIDDSRYDKETVAQGKDVPLLQYRSVKEKLFPVRDRILTVMMGNHDWKHIRKVGNLVKDYVCAELKVPYGTYTCKLLINDKKSNLMYKIFLTHGFGALNSNADDPVRRLSNMQLALKRKLSQKAADCAIMAMGHNHKLITVDPLPTLYLVDENNDVQQHYIAGVQSAQYIHPDHRWYCATGSFFKLYGLGMSGYGEVFGYDPHELGCCIVHVENKTIVRVEKKILHT